MKKVDKKYEIRIDFTIISSRSKLETQSCKLLNIFDNALIYSRINFFYSCVEFCVIFYVLFTILSTIRIHAEDVLSDLQSRMNLTSHYPISYSCCSRSIRMLACIYRIHFSTFPLLIFYYIFIYLIYR